MVSFIYRRTGIFLLRKSAWRKNWSYLQQLCTEWCSVPQPNSFLFLSLSLSISLTHSLALSLSFSLSLSLSLSLSHTHTHTRTHTTNTLHTKPAANQHIHSAINEKTGENSLYWNWSKLQQLMHANTSSQFLSTNNLVNFVKIYFEKIKLVS